MEVPSTSSSECGTSTTSKLGKCEVCIVKEAKYTCPRCEVKFCCLRCSVIHKKELECNGIRDKTKFIPIKKFTNLDLSSDYRLLEEIGRHVETYKKDRKWVKNPKDDVLPHYLFKLKKAAKLRKMWLKYLPRNFIRHKENTSRLNFHINVIFWRIDWIFCDNNNLKLVDQCVRETDKIGWVLQKYFDKQENKLLQEKLQYYQALGFSGIKVLLRAEEKAGDKFYELDIGESLKDNLQKKVIIEYPTIYVINKDHFSNYEIIDPDDNNKMDVDSKNETGKDVINKLVKRAESEDSIHNSLRNLLFVTEHSDHEDE